MIIDFHTHAFPDYLAPKAMSILCHQGGGTMIPCHNGTITELIENMDTWNIDYSVLAPIVTKASQTISLNEWAASTADTKRIIPFGSYFPHTDDYKRDIDYIYSLGLRGIKLHPEYQDFHLLDEKIIKSYEYALSKGLILLFHAGEDDGLPPPYKSSPKDFAYLADLFEERFQNDTQFGKIVVAHLGSYRMWDKVYTDLAGRNIYFDTAMGFQTSTGFSEQTFLNIVAKHGADKILFGSDSPWSKACDELDTLFSYPISQKEKEMIAGKNAQKLLNMV